VSSHSCTESWTWKSPETCKDKRVEVVVVIGSTRKEDQITSTMTANCENCWIKLGSEPDG
jgi:hypothetical protein